MLSLTNQHGFSGSSFYGDGHAGSDISRALYLELTVDGSGALAHIGEAEFLFPGCNVKANTIINDGQADTLVQFFKFYANRPGV